MTNRVHWRLGDQEIEIEGDIKFINQQLKLFLERLSGSVSGPPPKDLPSKIVASAKAGKILSPAEYIRQKAPNGGTETLIVLGKYLDEFRNKGEFTGKDIKQLAREAKITAPQNVYYTRAVKQGFLRAVGRATYGLSITGEDAVAAMPSKKA